jgi:hypothetical protein
VAEDHAAAFAGDLAAKSSGQNLPMRPPAMLICPAMIGVRRPKRRAIRATSGLASATSAVMGRNSSPVTRAEWSRTSWATDESLMGLDRLVQWDKLVSKPSGALTRRAYLRR